MRNLSLSFPIFILLGIVFIPFTFQFFAFQFEITEFVFGGVVDFLADSIGIQTNLTGFTSDSKRAYLLIAVLLICSVAISMFLHQFQFSEKKRIKLLFYIRIIATYYLACILLKYGFDKLFKCQFYLPEPNILHSRLGNLDKDILFWSTIGSSYSYSVFMGLMEIIPGLFLFFRKSRNIGLLLAIGVFVNVVAVNFSFDISVKLYSLFLLVITVYLFSPILNPLWNLLVNKQIHSLSDYKVHHFVFQRKSINQVLKIACIVFVLLESLYPYLKIGNFNDDKFPRPILHGVYELRNSLIGNDSLSKQESVIQRVFVHRDGYLIFQDQNEEMYDYKLTVNESKKQFVLTDYDAQKQVFDYSYSNSTELLKLNLHSSENREIYTLKKVDWRKMPLLQKQFHWTVD